MAITIATLIFFLCWYLLIKLIVEQGRGWSLVDAIAIICVILLAAKLASTLQVLVYGSIAVLVVETLPHTFPVVRRILANFGKQRSNKRA